MRQRYCARGLTAIEIVLVLVVVVVIIAIVLPSLPRTRRGSRPMKDATQVRGVQQAMAIWANSNKGEFPLPSKIDFNNTTVLAQGTAKDTTANILSVLIYTGSISPELLYSPAEVNSTGIEMDMDYMFDRPTAAVDPDNALWDPAFAADFTNGNIGNTSYAHVMPGGGRGKLWRDTFQTTEPIIGNRGPEVKAVTDDGNRRKPQYVLKDSNTFLIHGSRGAWEGNIAYNDGHVTFETRTLPDGVIYLDAAGNKVPDCLFFDEPDDATGLNAFMSIWTKAGDTKIDFRPIWD